MKAKGSFRGPVFQLSGLRLLIRRAEARTTTLTRGVRPARVIHQLRQNARQLQAHFRAADYHNNSLFRSELTALEQILGGSFRERSVRITRGRRSQSELLLKS